MLRTISLLAKLIITVNPNSPVPIRKGLFAYKKKPRHFLISLGLSLGNTPY